MTSVANHGTRVEATVAAFEASMARFLARVEATPDDIAERPPRDGDGAWSVAGIAWHVAVTNEQFAGLVDGTVPVATAPDADFAETPFAELTAVVPDQLEAPEKYHPPSGITKADALARARASQERLARALREMPESRGL